jgi:hypothetical protein
LQSPNIHFPISQEQAKPNCLQSFFHHIRYKKKLRITHFQGTEDLLVSHDRASFLRPTKSVLLNSQLRDMKHWKTATNIHMDMGPWDYLHNPEKFENVLGTLQYGKNLNHFIFENNQIMSTVNGGLHVQGVLNLADNHECDGGFQIVPGNF